MTEDEVPRIEALLSISWEDVGSIHTTVDGGGHGKAIHKFYSPSMVSLGTLVRASESDDLELPE
jgi:hypothetical protein|tara:strand:+ start:113 stop:304 length:192 start_codon:yes stop_codon:yes gene_type:complete